jgi:hypothetical protein
MTRVAIVSAARTPIGTFGGALKDTHVVDLGTLVIKEALRRGGIKPEDVDEVIMGNVLTGGMGMNTARQATIRAGLPDTTPAFTINKVCGSGLKSVALAAQAIQLGGGDEHLELRGPLGALGNTHGERAARRHDDRRRSHLRDGGLPHGNYRRKCRRAAWDLP